MTKLLGLIAVAALALAFAAPAMAQTNPTNDAYGGVLGDQVASTGGGGPGDSAGGTAGSEDVSAGATTLPFTGMEVGLILLLGGALVATGLALRPASRRQSLG